MIESLRKLDKAYARQAIMKDAQGEEQTAGEMASYFANAMISIFTRNADGKRPVYGENHTFQHDIHWKDYILFSEYFDGDTGKGLGASHQTGWNY
jgi:hypothetical protein